jgi:hypothetical protein
LLLKGTDEHSLNEVTELAEMAELHSPKFQSCGKKEQDFAGGQASLVFDIPEESEIKLKKQLKFYSIFSGVGLQLSENCIQATSFCRERIVGILDIIRDDFKIGSQPVYAGASKTKTVNRIEGETTVIKKEKIKQEVKQENEIEDITMNHGRQSIENTATQDENSMYVNSFKIAVSLHSAERSVETKTAKKAFTPIQVLNEENHAASVSRSPSVSENDFSLRRVVERTVETHSDGSAMCASIPIPSFSVARPCLQLDLDLVNKKGPCSKLFTFKNCRDLSRCPFAHVLPSHMKLSFCCRCGSTNGNKSCVLSRCVLMKGELNKNYDILKSQYKKEIKRLQKECVECDLPERSRQDETVLETSNEGNYENEEAEDENSQENGFSEMNVTFRTEASEETESQREFLTRNDSPRIVVLEEPAEEREEIVYIEGELSEEKIERRVVVDAGGASSHKTNKKLCIYYRRGHCDYGKNCRNLHEASWDLRDRLRINSADLRKDLRETKLSGSRSPRRNIAGTAKVYTDTLVYLDKKRQSVRCTVDNGKIHDLDQAYLVSELCTLFCNE